MHIYSCDLIQPQVSLEGIFMEHLIYFKITILFTLLFSFRIEFNVFYYFRIFVDCKVQGHQINVQFCGAPHFKFGLNCSRHRGDIILIEIHDVYLLLKIIGQGRVCSTLTLYIYPELFTCLFLLLYYIISLSLRHCIVLLAKCRIEM